MPSIFSRQLRKDVDNFLEVKNSFLESFSSTNQLKDWHQSISETSKDRYEMSIKNGRYGGTWVNKKDVIAYAAWLNEGFGFAVIDATQLLASKAIFSFNEL